MLMLPGSAAPGGQAEGAAQPLPLLPPPWPDALQSLVVLRPGGPRAVPTRSLPPARVVLNRSWRPAGAFAVLSTTEMEKTKGGMSLGERWSLFSGEI